MLNLSLTQNHSLSTEKWNKYFALGTKAMTTVLLFITLLLFGTLSAQTIKQSKLVCTSDKSCTSKDLEVVSVEIDAPLCTTCKVGDVVTFPLKMTIHNGTGSVRTSFSLYGTLSNGATINGFSGNIFICVGAITVTKGDQTFLNVGTITYKCGDPLTLTNNYLAWTDAAGNTTDRCETYSNATKCSDIAPKCGTAASITIQGPLGATATPTAVKCKGDATGSINLTPSGGKTPYTFLWSTGATTEDISGLKAGTYSVTITDANKCTFNISAEVKEPAAALTATTKPTAATCKGGATGSIDLTPSGGTSPYTFLWSNGATTEDISGLTAGTYSVTITDANKCTFTTSATVADGATPDAPKICIVQPSLCDASLTGFKISFLNPVAGSQYSIDDGKTWFTTSVFCNVAPGSNPIMRVKNAAGCVSDPTTCTSSNVTTCTDNPTCPTSAIAATQSTSQKTVSAQQIEIAPQPTVKAAPNPYNDKVRFSVKSAVSGQGTLDLYNMLGQKVKTVFQGHVEAGQVQNFEYNVPNAQRSNLIYIFRVGDQKVTGKLLELK